MTIELERHASETTPTCLVNQPFQRVRGLRVRQSVTVNIGNAVAQRVRAADTRAPAEIDTETVRHRQAGTLANQYGDDLGTQSLAELVTDCDARLFGDCLLYTSDAADE